MISMNNFTPIEQFWCILFLISPEIFASPQLYPSQGDNSSNSLSFLFYLFKTVSDRNNKNHLMMKSVSFS